MRLGVSESGFPSNSQPSAAGADGASGANWAANVAEIPAGSSRYLAVSLASSGVAQVVLVAGLAAIYGSMPGYLRFAPPPPGAQSVASTRAVASVQVIVETTEEVPFDHSPEPLRIAASPDSRLDRLDTEPAAALARQTTESAPVAPLPMIEAPPAIEVAVGFDPPAQMERPQRAGPQPTLPAESPSVRRQTPARRLPPNVEKIVAPATPAAAPAVASVAANGARTDSPPVAVFNPSPTYPPAALAARLTGRVIVRVRVRADGMVEAVSMHQSSGVTSLDETALDAVRRWRFTPFDKTTSPTRDVAVPIRFVLED